MSEIITQTPENSGNPQSVESPSYLTAEEAIRYLKSRLGVEISVSTLAKLRHERKPPHFTKFGKKVYYTKSDLNAFVQEEMNKNQKINPYQQ